MVLMSVESENGSVLTYRLAKNQIAVGSSSKNDIVVRSSGVAERHLVVHRNKNLFTFVTVDRQTVVLNGERRARGVLNPGDKLRLGTMTLVFRGSEDEEGDLPEVAEVSAHPVMSLPERKVEGDTLTFRADPAGFGEARLRLVELFLHHRSDRLQQLVALLREALPEAEVVLLAPGELDNPIALASVWTGPLPKINRAILNELAAPGRYAVLSGGDGSTVAVAAATSNREVTAVIAARPAGVLGNEGVSLLAEAARFLAVQWHEVERRDVTFTGWEAEARQRLDALLPGTSQAIQVLRAGVLAAAHDAAPVLICGAEGTGRTEVARVLATLGPVAGRSVTIFEGRDGDLQALREELFGSARRPTLVGEQGGLLGQAKGGLMVVRHLDQLPPPLQAEIASIIAAHNSGTLSPHAIRWVATCGEDPLALVQTGKLVSALFMSFSRHLLRVPRVAERREDLPLLVGTLLRRSASDQQKSVRGITLDCLNMLLSHDFPREMSELVGEINRLVTATPDGEMVRCDDLAPRSFEGGAASSEASSELTGILASNNLKEVIPRVEQLLIDRVMKRVKGNQSKGARVLGISRGALIAKLREYSVPDYRYLRRRKAP